MPIDHIVEQIVLMPRTLKEKDLSEYEFLKKIGYFQEYDKVSEKQIYLKLTQFPERIDEWIQYSEDQRSESHYYIIQKGLSWFVNYWSYRDKSLNTSQEFFDKTKACAHFIKQFLEHTRSIFPKI
jgi:hypothetical protein